ncbi:hypothetical protein [Escherichia phage Ecp_YSF]|nr:hypothetical protein [Escherichia phage Ecp_YSF]
MTQIGKRYSSRRVSSKCQAGFVLALAFGFSLKH